MQIRTFRGKEFINREKEIEFFQNRFKNLPEEILWIYGPKSTGKTTLIEYVIENELFDDFKLFKSKNYNVKYINFRARAVYNYDSFVNSMLVNQKVAKGNWSFNLNLEFFVVSYEKIQEIKQKEVDIFKILEDEFRKS
ncbi:MAG: ATP-binding protein, partial [Desulfonauticus sp.]|nr:ATP-binding protein [Desulfonauticus sp.]